MKQQTQREWSAEAEYRYYRSGHGHDRDAAPILKERANDYKTERLQFGFFWPDGADAATRGKLVLDLACGESFTGCAIAELLPVEQVVCLDAVVPQIYTTFRAWQQHAFTNNINFVIGDAYQLPFADRHIDMVVVSRAIHHFPQFYRVLFEIDRVLAPGGSVIIVEPNDNGIYSFIMEWEEESRSDNEGFIRTGDIDRFFRNLSYSVDVSYYTVRFPLLRAKYLSTNYLLRAKKSGAPLGPRTSLNRETNMFHCPVTHLPLRRDADSATTEDGKHSYPVIGGLPVLLPPSETRQLAEADLLERAGTVSQETGAVAAVTS